MAPTTPRGRAVTQKGFDELWQEAEEQARRQKDERERVRAVRRDPFAAWVVCLWLLVAPDCIRLSMRYVIMMGGAMCESRVTLTHPGAQVERLKQAIAA